MTAEIIRAIGEDIAPWACIVFFVYVMAKEK